ncbi:MAG: 1,2-phenylacetyl-CoA epoxidase subunit PaaC [Flavipsychrobacter sp.]
MDNKLIYTLQLADNAMVIGHRLSEWCGHGPVLEQDIALTNIALDHLGQARSLYQYAAKQYNALTKEEKHNAFASVSIQQLAAEGKDIDEDDLPFLRDAWDFRNVLLVEQPNNDWAYTIVRSFIYDTYNYTLYSRLKSSSDEVLAAIAEKSLKEVSYHLRWSSEWMIRLGDGTAESKERIQKALKDYWSFSGELTKQSDAEKELSKAGIIPNGEQVKTDFDARIKEIISEATLSIPEEEWMQDGGKTGTHTEHMGFILAELQYMQRAYPNMEW